ncbi:DUF4132 domain-containing protein [Luteimicrobium subarcticum]|uniref:HEAT repeat protein n=1 Tax=Luteimicrobium subarcticum TaxID=620910 RepID=A0A2M8WRE4_9MICO|nr:DUF4132 domain-containing protein [Luteimicrobium subarcticum]PJI93512.1 HEAT repeat protein [Luteimicrobium subarcticum]
MPLFGRTRRKNAAKGSGAQSADDALRDALGRVLEPHGGDDAVRYVLTGEGADVLARLPRTSFHRFPHLAGSDAEQVCAGLAGDPGVLRRFGRVLDAVAGHGRWGFVLGELGGERWPELVLWFATEAAGTTRPLPLGFDDLVAAAAADGRTRADLLACMFDVGDYATYRSGRDWYVRLAPLPGLVDALREHEPLVQAAVTSGSVVRRECVLALLGSAVDDAGLVPFAPATVAAATGSSGQVRDAARPLLVRLGDAAVEPLREVATGGNPEQRRNALTLLGARPDQREWAVSTAAADRAASVRTVAAQLAAAAAADDADGQEEPLPDLPAVSWAVPAEDAQRIAERVVPAIDAHATSFNRHVARMTEFQRSRGLPVREQRPRPMLGRRGVTDLVGMLRSDDAPEVFEPAATLHHFSAGLGTAAASTDLGAVAAVKLMVFLGFFGGSRYRLEHGSVLADVHRRTPGTDLLTVQALLDAAGVDGREVLWSAYARRWSPLARDWPDEDVAPFVRRNLDWILAETDRTRAVWEADPAAVYSAVATLETPPRRVVEHFYAAALGTRKTDRGPAQEALARDPGRTARTVAALSDGKSEVRLVAAQWLTRIADPESLPALRAAWRTERQDVVRGALLDALTALGDDAADHLDPATTLRAAEKALAKGLPASVSWLDLDALPEVTWASSGDAVPRVVVGWLCVAAVKARSPEPDAVLRYYASLLETDGRERLAAHLLAAWMREDLRPVPPHEAEQRALQHATSSATWLTRPGQQYEGMTVEQARDALLPGLLPGYLREPAGSATASKGVLAVVAALGGRDVVAPSERYLREWYGQRAAQGKALLAMLAWVDDRSATQLVLSVGSRFRTKSFQDEATRLASELAERRGWTLDELADRTVPAAGFVADGVLELSYGPRTFTARLRPDLTIDLRDPDGAAVRTLPTPRKTDDAEVAAASRKALTAARKELKAVERLQRDRLYEALCTQRSWSAEDWTEHLLQHSVVGALVRRLVWVATDDDGGALTFRPLDDGTLTDADDEPVDLPAGARVRIAHDSLLAPDDVARWTAHLADYEVTPLFEQLGRGVHTADPKARGLGDFEGHVVGSYALRSRATRLGYGRGQTEDAGWFYGYDKRFQTLGIVARVEFTGNFLPEEDRLVALRALTFHRLLPEGREADLTVGDVPAVLVSECWNDARTMAADGPGFDPDWAKKTEY